MTKKIVRRRKERGRKKYLRALLVMLCFCLLITVCPFMPGAAVVHAAGDGTDANPWLCGAEADGSNVKATLINGTLTISGNGKMQDYTGSRPWNDSTASITRVVIKEGVTSIGNNVFNGCSALESITIPTSVTSIGLQAFLNCSSLTEIKIPAGVTNFGTNPFGGCSNLTKIEVDGENKNYKSQNDAILTIKGDTLVVGCKSTTTIPEGVTSIRSYAFSGCSGLTSVTIPDSVTSIGNYAFKGCSGLTSIEIPAGVNSIGNNAFFNCIKLMKVTMHRENRENLPTLGTNAFYGCPCVSGNTKGIYVPVGTGDAYKEEEGWSTYGAHIAEIVASGTCGNKVTWTLTDDGTLTISGEGEMDDHNSSGGVPFDSYRSMIKTVVIENGVKSIGGYAFWQCSNLTSVTIPESVESIGGLAFDSCSKLTSITIPGSVRSIGSYAFSGCNGLTSITIPESVTSIGESVFSGCSGLESINVKDGNTTYNSRNNCNAIIKTEGNILVAGCKNTTIPDSVTSIGDSAFNNCSGLTSITIPDSVTCIGDSAFNNCSGLTSITIPDSVTSIEKAAFNHCTNLTSVTIPDSVKTIGSNAFSNCEKLTSVTIGNGVTNIRSTAFKGCRNLAVVEMQGDTPPKLGTSVFPSLTTIKIPSCQYKVAENWSEYNITPASTDTFHDGFTYTATDIGITQTCACKENSGTVTLTVKEGVSLPHTYTGGEIEPFTVTYRDWKVQYDNPVSITYKDNQNVGMATATLSVGTESVSTTFLINSKLLTDESVSMTLDATSYQYTEKAIEPTVTVTDSAVEDGRILEEDTDYTVGYENNTEVGTDTAKVIIEGKGNYSGSITKTFTITPATMSVSVSGYEDTYDAKSHSIDVRVTSPADAAITYSTDGENYSSTNPSFTNAVNSTTVFYKIEKENYQPVTGSATVKITPRSISSATVTLDNTDLTYNGSEQTKDVSKVTVSVDGKILTLIKGTDYKVSGNTQTNAGNHTITIRGIGNYTGSITKTFTIASAAMPRFSVTGYEGFYDGTAHGITVTAPKGAKVKYGTEEGNYNRIASPTYTDVGTHTVYYQVKKDNYTTVTGSVEVKIEAFNIEDATVELDSTALTYSGSAQTKSVSKVTVEVNGEPVTLNGETDYKVSGNTQTNAGNHTITIRGIGNYTGSITKTFTITPAAMTGVSATGHKGTYDGESHGITVTASDGATVKYRNEEGTYDLTASPTYINAGTYTVYFQVTKDNYKPWSSSVNVIIEARDISGATVTLDNNDLTYNGSAQTKNVSSVIVEVNSKTRTLTEGTDYEVSGNTQTNAGTHTITIEGKGNYSGSTTKTFTIASAAMTGVSANGYEGTYDGIAHGITVTAPDGATKTYSTDGGKNYGSGNPSYTNAGTYTVHYKITKDNYETIEGYKTVKINKKSLTITASNQSIMWGKSIDKMQYMVPADGMITGDQISKITLTPSTEALTDNGTISISGVQIKNASNEIVTGNYDINTVNGTLEVTHNTALAPKEIVAEKTKTSYTAGDALNVDDITVTASYEDKYSEEVTDFKTNVADIDMSEAGEKILTVSYTKNNGTATANITITVNEKQVTDGDWSGVVTSGSVKIVGYSGSDTAVEVPSIIDGMPVTVIGKDAFAGHTDITSVTIPDSVTVIGESAFSGCTGLTTITIPDSVTAIGENAFVGCTGLTTVIIPNGVDTTSAGITDMAAKITYKDENGTITITSVTPGKDGDIEKPVTLPDMIGGIKPEISETVKEKMKDIPHEDKGGTATCTKKAVCEICGEEYGAPAGHEYEVTWEWTEAADDYTATAIIICAHADSDWQCDFTDKKITGEAAGDVKVTSEVTETATCEVAGERTYTASLVYNEVTYTSEEKETIPAKGHTLQKKEAKKPTSTEAGNKEYWTCTACNKLFADEQGKTETNSTEVTIPPTGDGEAWSSVITSDGLKIVGYSGSDTTVEVPSKIGDMPVTAIGDNAFAGNTEITSVTIPGSVTTIGKDAFAGCTGLTTITIPENLDTKDAGITDTVAKITYTVDEEGGKINITSVTSGSGTAVEIPYEIDGMPVTAIGDNAFVGNTEITSVTIPDSVTTIGMGAFSGCTGLTTITIPENLDTKDAGITDTVAKITYTVDETGKITITSVTPGSNTAVEVPSEIDGMPVTAIGENAFAGCTGLTTITIPDSVTAIGKNAFSDCVGLTSVTIPDSVTAIGEGAFSGCTGLTDITIPDSVTAIGENAFSGCTGLTTVIIPNGVDTTSAGITDTAVKITYTVDEENGKITITSVTPGSNTAVEVPSEIGGKPVTAIGENVFAGNTEITSVTIPDSVTTIGEGAFSGCTGLTDITIPDSVTTIGKDAFSGCTGLTSVTIPDSVTAIGEDAFSGCTGLTSVTIPDSVTAIGEDAFSGCTGLTSVTISDSVTAISEGAFSGCTGLTDITIPDSVTEIGKDAFSGCTGLTDITIPDSVTTIGENAFSDCTGLTTVIIPNGVDTTNAGITGSAAKITYKDENGTITITSVTPGGGTAVEVPSEIDGKPVTAIGENAFAGNSEITSVTIPDSVTAIGEDAFSGCTGLTSVTIPDGVTAISEGAFSGCTGLTDITIPDSVTEIGKDAFAGCTGLTDITIPDSVTEIGKDAFAGCTGLTDITIPDSVTAIGKDAFADCTGLTTINIPNSVDTTSAGITDTATKITYKDENGKITITSVTPGGDTAIELPSEIDGRPVTAIGENAFAGNTEITSVTIPGSVTTIGKDAFSGCTGLTTIIIPENLDTTSAGIINTAAKITYKDENGKITITSVTPGTDGDGGEKPVILPDTIGGKKPEIPDAVKEEIKNISHEHKGGTATCTQKAVCEICGVEYGDFAGHTLVKIEGVEPTHAADGSMAYWTCSKCGKKFSDENGATEITDPTIPATGNESPKSGDDSNPAFWTLLMLMSMTALVGLFVKKRKTERHDER